MEATTESSQYTLEGNEVAQIADMDAAGTDAETHAAEVAAQAVAQAELQANSAIQQVEGGDLTEEHQHQEHPQAAGQMDIDHAQIAALSEATNAPAATLPTIPSDEHGVPVHVNSNAGDPEWHSYFSQLQQHQSTFGTLDVDPQTNPPLYEWVETQRKLIKLEKEGHNGSISPERMVLLDALGFDWEGARAPDYGAQAIAVAAAANGTISGPTHEVEAFYLRLSELEQFKTLNGHLNIPESYKENPVLGKWVHQQRMLFKKRSLDRDRIEALLALGFDFTVKDKSVAFETRIEQLKAYRALHGDLNIPRHYPNKGLGEWLWNQKRLYRRWESGREGGMGAGRRRVMIDLGIDFSEPPKNEGGTSTTSGEPNQVAQPFEEDEEIANRSTKWDDKFHELREYKLAHGHTNVPRRSKRNPGNDALGEWVHFQRRQYRNLLNGKNSTMTIARKKALEVLDFQWSRSGTAFQQNNMNGHITFMDKATAVRDAVQIQILRAHEEGKTAPWDDRFAQLTEYVQRFGNADVPINYAENLSLGSWVYRQRIAHKLWKEPQASGIDEGIAEVPDNITKPIPENVQLPQESELNLDEGTLSAIEAQTLGSDQVETLPNADAQSSSNLNLQLPQNENDLSTNQHNKAPQSVITNDMNVLRQQGNNEPAFQEVDRMTQERYDKLVAVGFDFEIKKIPDDFITADGQEPAALILSKTAEEEEQPLIEDEQDVLEISLGDEEVFPVVNSSTKADMEINDVEVSAILNGNEDNVAAPHLENRVAMVNVSQEENVDGDNPITPGIENSAVVTVNVSQQQSIDVSLDTTLDNTTVANNGERKSYDESDTRNQSGDIAEQNINVSDMDNGVEIDLANINKSENSQIIDDMKVQPPFKKDEMAEDLKLNDVQNPDNDKKIEASPAPEPVNMTNDKDTSDGLIEYHPIINQDENKPNGEKELSHIDLPERSKTGGAELDVVAPVEHNDQNITNQLVPPPTESQNKVNPSHELNQPCSKRRKVTTTVRVEWEERVLELIQYKIRKRNCNVPMKWRPNPGLSSWVWRQRDQYRLYRLGLPSILTATRIAKLTELGFEFVIHDPQGNPVFHDESRMHSNLANDEKSRPAKGKSAVVKQKAAKTTPKNRFKEGKWLQSLAKVVAFKEENGHCNVPRKWKNEPTLGEWVHFQRRQYRLKQLNRRNHMTEPRIRKLEAIGFEWSRGNTHSSYPNPNYSAHKDVNVYHMDPPEEHHTAPADIDMPNAEEMMVEYMQMEGREQVHQIADVVEQHVTVDEHQMQMDHQVTAHLHMDHVHQDPHQQVVLQDKIELQTADIEPIPVHTTPVHTTVVHTNVNSAGEEQGKEDDTNILSV